MKYYFINDEINPDTIYGAESPVCISEAELNRLSAEWDVDLREQMHEATSDEIETYGTYDEY